MGEATITTLVDVFVPVMTVSGSNLREHWGGKARRVKRERETALTWLRLHGKFPADWPGGVAVTLTRTGGRGLDDDNLRSAFKAVRDGVSDWMGRDDADPRVEWRYAERVGGEKGTEILVELVTGGD